MLTYITVLVLLIVGFFVVRAMLDPGYGLAIVLSMFCLEQFLQSASGFFVSNSSYINIGVAGVAAGAVTMEVLRRGTKAIKISKAHLLWAALMGFVVLSIVWSISDGTAKNLIQKQVPYIVVFAILGPLCLTNSDQLSKAINSTIVMGGLILLAIALTGFGRRSLVLAHDFSTGQGVEGNPLAIATYAGIVGLCCIFSMYANRSLGLAKNAIKIAVALLAIYVVARSGSRGQLIAVVIAAFIWLPVTAKVAAKRSTILALASACAVLVGCIWLVEQAGTSYRWRDSQWEVASEGRVAQVQYVLESWFDEGPVAWMIGLGNSACYGLIGIYPHNVPAEIIVEEGLIGLGLYLAFLITVTIQGFRVIRNDDIDPVSRVQIGAFLAIFTFLFGLGLKQGSLLGQSNLFCVGIALGLICEQMAKSGSSKKLPSFVSGIRLPPQYVSQSSMNHPHN